jgi:hypothetical protein
MPSQTIEVFPTIIKRYDVSHIFNDADVQVMISDIDFIHNDCPELMVDAELCPKHQCKPILFDKRLPFVQQPHWQKLSMSFVQCINDYNQTVTNMIHNQELLTLFGTRAWFYKNRQESNLVAQQRHNHTPSYLSGVFYLRIPGDLNTGGTCFYDPRGSNASKTHFVVPPILLTWIIFPGWLEHAPERINSNEWRYTIAADSYVFPEPKPVDR